MFIELTEYHSKQKGMFNINKIAQILESYFTHPENDSKEAISIIYIEGSIVFVKEDYAYILDCLHKKKLVINRYEENPFPERVV